MARIEYGPLASRLAGSIGGSTFQKAGSAAIVRRKPAPGRPQKPKQREIQALFAQGSAQWKALEAGTKAAWVARAATVTLYNSLGQAYQPTGQQYFVWAWVTWHLCPMATGMPPVPATGTPTEHVPTFAMSGTILRITAFAPTYYDMDGAVATLFWPDTPRATVRTPQLLRVQLDTAHEAPPYYLYDFNDLPGGLGSARRVFIHLRFMDTSQRPSLLYKYFYDVPV